MATMRGRRNGARLALLLPGAALASDAAAGAQPVVFEFYYGLGCENCEYFMTHMGKNLLEAGLPGDQVQVTLLPVLGGRGSAPELAHLCALRSGVEAPFPVDSPELASAAKFVACDLGNIQRDQASEAAAKACAAEAGVDWDGLAACVNGDEGVGILQSAAFAAKMQSIRTRPHSDSEPYLFFNDAGLDCGTPYPTSCWATYGPDGSQRKLPAEGSLAYVACSALPGPLPAACSAPSAAGVAPAAAAGAGHTAGLEGGSTTVACQNCNEVGSFNWLDEHRARPAPDSRWLLAAVCALFSLAVLARSGVLWRRPDPQRLLSNEFDQGSDAEHAVD
ncbi:unnamed protein product [Prorocentrum cordatum]|uniref:Uncharacterized protein n=1 Tax=Prorocentrum cordatum TaxID=2364126 RepID=A0ABN9RXA9_9DINO|nr:unnamed protein product [Polarella glacialis]